MSIRTILVPFTLALLGWATLTSAVSAGGAAPDTLVRLQPGAGRETVDRLHAAGATRVSSRIRLWRVPAAAGTDTVRALRRTDAIVSTHPERTYSASLSATGVPDPLVAQQWWRAAIGVEGLTPPGPGVPVTVVDSGVDLMHPELAGRANLLALNRQEPAPFGGVHGTAVTSVIGATRNGVGVEGIYADAVLRTWDAALGTGSELTSAQIAAGILAAVDAGRGVINLSLGGLAPDPSIEAAVDEAVAHGSLVVVASGNDGLEGSPLSYPASYPHVLTIAATQPDGTRAPWSSSSRYVDLAAPGAQIPVAIVDSATGAETWAAWDGTSFAAPLVSGAAAWLWTVRPSLDADQVAEILRRSARDVASPGRDPATGFGLLDMPAALAAPAPAPDTPEPDDDAADVVPGRADYRGIAPLTTRDRPTGRTRGRLDASEDPRDVHRIWLPARSRLTATTTADAGVSLQLAATTARSVATPGKQALARSAQTGAATRRLTYRNDGPGRWALAVVAPSGPSTTSYTLSVTAR